MSFELIQVSFRRARAAASSLRAVLGLVAAMFVTFAPCETQNAIANGDTRTIELYHAHTKETITATYLVDGAYDQAVLTKLNWFLRDWRRDEPTHMDPKLFDVIWEVHRESGSRQPIEVMSAYRSPETNAMLRRRSRQVAEHSQHILGKAMDQHYMDVPMSKIREIAMRLQRGGVGFYPTAGTPFVHMDVGGVRHWPRMSYDQLARLFPDGKTVHIPSNGQPLSGYEEARAELEARGGESYPTAGQIKSKGFFAWLFGSGDEDEDNAAEGVRSPAPATVPSRNSRVAVASRGSADAPVAAYDPSSKDAGSRSFFAGQQQQTQPAAPPVPYGRVARDVPDRMQPVPAPQPLPQTEPAPQAVLAEAMTQSERPASEAQTMAQPPVEDRSVPDLAVPAQTLASAGLAAPMPPRRPMELAALGVSPVPPVRPAELSRPVEAPAPTPGSAAKLAKADGIGALLAGKGGGLRLPAVITQGGSERSPIGALAYAGGSSSPASRADRAPDDIPLPVVRPADLVRARLDKANFRSLTSVSRTAAVSTQPGLGATVGVRAASRASLGAYATTARASTSFGNKASDLATDRFAGPALKAQERLVTSRRADAASRSASDN